MVIVGTGIVGTVTAIRKSGIRASDGLPNTKRDPYDLKNESTLPPYIEVDGWIQAHPSKVRLATDKEKKGE